MKKTTVFVIALTLLAWVHSSNAALVITEVMSSSAHAGGTNNGDWFELTNTGPLALNITGWSWDDNSNTFGSANFGSFTSLAAGQSVIFSEETIGAEAAWITDWGITGVTVVNLGGSVFQGLGAGAGGDAVNIYNASNALVTSVTFGTATAGLSFEWDTFGNSLGLSAIGQNGAFQSVENGQTNGAGPGVDVGSPGTAVPEPTAAMLLGSAGMMLWALRRKRTLA